MTALRRDAGESSTGGSTDRRRTEGTERTINLNRPWRRVRMADLVEEKTGLKFNKGPFTSAQIDQLRAQKLELQERLEEYQQREEAVARASKRGDAAAVATAPIAGDSEATESVVEEDSLTWETPDRGGAPRAGDASPQAGLD